MTRTQRSTDPHALIKDRSEARNGLDKSMKKQGGGPHSWGSLKDEARLELEADEDERFEEDLGQDASRQEPLSPKTVQPGEFTEEEERVKTEAINIRTGIKNGGPLDLNAIAQTSVAVSGSPPRSRNEFSPVSTPSEAHTTRTGDF
ncbi:hypothetical protein DACRYDRAFT_22448 [Dacryopinax primogenitus]|uniref:Hyaluronan/mRNA-binding protein domain-containing protein n=1 Tax=Dacryopinax primogenitus (strain DJM 731) TaxID=1858805 RepID=M5FXM4_DACPD|nr:uncharacterized protein DACRYDRAFT_22448 [Dacryopinax primogenitus]EJU01229.1 hypothetical protein DACRYDRAFT_22448 [Dacryopinax primogenitus]